MDKLTLKCKNKRFSMVCVKEALNQLRHCLAECKILFVQPYGDLMQIHVFAFQHNVDVVSRIEKLESVLSLEEQVRPKDWVYLQQENMVLCVEHILKINSVYIIYAGNTLYHLLDSRAEDLIKTWQFKANIFHIASPLEVSGMVTVSRKLVNGVSQYTSELREEKYFY